MVDLSKTLEGHIIKWAKGHYADKTFDQVVQAYTGYEHDTPEREKCKIMMMALVLSGQAAAHTFNDIVQGFFTRGAMLSGKLTSYHVGPDDNVPARSLGDALKSALNLLPVNNVVRPENSMADSERVVIPLVKLPELGPFTGMEEV